jgi:hypothetical protein
MDSRPEGESLHSNATLVDQPNAGLARLHNYYNCFIGNLLRSLPGQASK